MIKNLNFCKSAAGFAQLERKPLLRRIMADAQLIKKYYRYYYDNRRNTTGNRGVASK